MVPSPFSKCYERSMHSRMLFALALIATGCVERAHAQSAPRFRVRAPSDGGDPALSRDGAVPALLLGAPPDAAEHSLGTRIGNVSGNGGLGPALMRVGTSGRPLPSVDMGLGVSHHGLGRSGGSGNGGSGGGARAIPSRAVALRVSVESTGAGLPIEVVRRALATRQAQFAYCFERAMAPGSGAVMTVIARFDVVRSGGSAPRVVVHSTRGGPEQLNACVRARISAVVFMQPTTAAPVRVTYTLSA
jgi:hypothetical protein